MEVRAKPQYCRGRDSMGSLLSELATVEADGDGGGGGGGLGANQQCGSSRSKRQTNHSKETAVDWWVGTLQIMRQRHPPSGPYFHKSPSKAWKTMHASYGPDLSARSTLLGWKKYIEEGPSTCHRGLVCLKMPDKFW